MVESVHWPWFWHGIEAQAAVVVAGGGGGTTPPPQEVDRQDAGHSVSIVVPIGSGGINVAVICVIVSAFQLEQGPSWASMASWN